jgi:hypothetical protein
VSAERRNVPAVVETAALVTTSPTLHSSLAFPSMVANAGERASRRFLDFFAASIENDNTRVACYVPFAISSPGLSSTASASAPISSLFMSQRI